MIAEGLLLQNSPGNWRSSQPSPDGIGKFVGLLLAPTEPHLLTPQWPVASQT